MRKLLVLLLVVAVALTACNAFSVEDGVLSFDVIVSQDVINRLVSDTARRATDRGDNVLFDDITNVELIEPNTIRVFGNGSQDGTAFSGSYDLEMHAESGALRLAVTAVDVPGISLDDPRLVAANADLTEAFSDQIVSEQGEGPISEVVIEDGALRIGIAAPLE